MSLNQDRKVQPTAAPRVTFLLGRVHERLGGPARTIRGYAEGLRGSGRRVTIAGIGTPKILADNFSDGDAREFVGLTGSTWKVLWSVLHMVRSQQEHDRLVLVGVWHLAFFAAGFSALLRWPTRPSQIYLIPTMSLTRYDWNKHGVIKRLLRPIISLILWRIDGVVFASTGELASSEPANWTKSHVILHPTSAVLNRANATSRDFDLAFVGRIDAQKDLELLLRAVAESTLRPNLVVLGDGDPGYVRALKALADSLQLGARVTWAGWASHDDVLATMRKTKVVAVTSVVENYCHVAVEALMTETELVLVDRVMSAADFQQLASIYVCSATPREVAHRLDESLSMWGTRATVRRRSAETVSRACSIRSAADALALFLVLPREAPTTSIHPMSGSSL